MWDVAQQGARARPGGRGCALRGPRPARPMALVGCMCLTRVIGPVGRPLRGVTQEIDFFWIALVVTQVNYVHRPRYKLQIYEEIAEKYYRSQKLCRRKVRNFFT